MPGVREIRRLAKDSVYGLLTVAIDCGEGDLWILAEDEGLEGDDLHEFTDELLRIRDRIHRERMI